MIRRFRIPSNRGFCGLSGRGDGSLNLEATRARARWLAPGCGAGGAGFPRNDDRLGDGIHLHRPSLDQARDRGVGSTPFLSSQIGDLKRTQASGSPGPSLPRMRVRRRSTIARTTAPRRRSEIDIEERWDP